MQLRLLRRRAYRQLRKTRRRAERVGSQAEAGLEEHFFGRLGNLKPLRRFLAAWLLLVLLLIAGSLFEYFELNGYYQSIKSVPGGIYTEGVLGSFTNANPIYAVTDADKSVSSLIFAGLFQYNWQGQLSPDLASGYQANQTGNTYTVTLKPGLKWQDGQPLTSADVVYTFDSIENPAASSPYQSSWQNVAVSAEGPDKVVFRLPDELAAFPDSLTMGILPKHQLAKIPPSDLRLADFNTISPVGSGPFSWDGVQVISTGDPTTEQELISLKPFSGYNGGGPKLAKFVVNVFASQNDLINGVSSGQVTAAEGLSVVPASLSSNKSVIDHSLLFNAARMVFFKTTAGVLSDQNVRQALVSAVNVPAIMGRLGYATREVREPLLAGQLGYDPAYAQSAYDPGKAKATLSSDGYQPGSGGVLSKGGQALRFQLTAADTKEDHQVAGMLVNYWRAVGADVSVLYLPAYDFQTAANGHDYDALLNTISIGSDPDVFVYWDSSQASLNSASHLNYSEFSNQGADIALESGRTRINPLERVIKYKPFLQAWQQAAPSLGLYQPRLIYLTNGMVSGLNNEVINSATDRFDNVQNWEIKQTRVTD